MKAAVLSSSDNLYLLPRVKDLLDVLYIEAHSYSVDENWFMNHQEKLISCFMENDIYIFLLGENDFNAPWLIYSLGVLRGNSSNSIFFFTNPELKVPVWLDHFNIAFQFSEIRDRILTYNETWEKKSISYIARKELEKQDIEIVKYNIIKAVTEGDRYLLGLLLDAGLVSDICNDNGVPLVSIAAREGHLGIIQVLVAAGANLNTVAEDRGNTPLMDAAAVGHKEVVQFLIENGSKLEHRSKNGQTALLLAVGNQRTESAMALIEAGAYTTTPDALGMSARKYAELFHEQNLIDFMDKYSRS